MKRIRFRRRSSSSSSTNRSGGSACTYCRHRECDRCRAMQKGGKIGYCCQCHREKVMK